MWIDGILVPDVPIALKIVKTIGINERTSERQSLKSAKEPVNYSFLCEPFASQYEIIAVVFDSKGHCHASSIKIQVTKPLIYRPPLAPEYSSIKSDSLSISLDKNEYDVGDEAEVTLQLPFASGSGITL